MKKKCAFLLAAFASTTVLGAGFNANVAAVAAPPPEVPPGVVTADERVADAADSFWRENPGDYVGLNRTIVKAGGDPVRFNFPLAGLSDLSPADAQRLQERANRSRTSTSDSTALATSIDPALLGISSYWGHTKDQYGEWYSFNGTYNFTNGYIKGEGTHDGLGVIVSQLPSTCWKFSSDWASAFDPLGRNWTGKAYREDSGARRSIWGIYDFAVWGNVDGRYRWMRNADHGTHRISFKRIGYGCGLSQAHGKFYYEHNVGGSGGWTASITMAALTLSYTSGPAERLRKATAPDYLQ